ncbi:FtsQ-type POTRA domain-containing protein [Berryella wangjianweii]|uniref:FtsQ-type POTRA domain-containing protein n=1 Tax=Berryella wangjianweii TaxID=2734634 RepID=A0A6M8J7T9_9ACTN|nr:FtsQ-type POTRA domain-containing protein [Berryella wangjianweii]
MASNYNRKSASSGSRRASRIGAPAGFDSRASRAPRASRASRDAVRTGPRRAPRAESNRSEATPPARAAARPARAYESVRIGDLTRQERHERAQQRSRALALRVGIAVGVAAVLLVAFLVLRSSSVFSIDNVSVKGVEHLTSTEMAQLAGVPAGATLLDVDAGAIERRIKRNAWVKSVSVSRGFPHTLNIDVVERTVAAVVEVPAADARTTKLWAISSDRLWLMPIPAKGTEAAAATSAKVYEDADAALHITDVPFGTTAAIGQMCTDSNVLNALGIVDGMTTDLAKRVKSVSAAGEEETVLILDNGVEIAFGKAEHIRDKERVVLKILEENEGKVSYINVRSVSKPTWRAVA